MIGIIGALNEEIDLVCNELADRQTTEKAQIVFHTGFMEKQKLR